VGCGTPSRPLSFGQEQLCFLEELVPGTSTYNVAVLYRLDGELDIAALRRAVEHVVGRHDVLRARFSVRDGVPCHDIEDSHAVDLPVTDLTELPHTGRDAAAAEAAVPFDLANGPVYRVRLFRVGARTHLFSLVIHHIAADGWSFGLINSEISTAYALIVEGRPLPAGRAPVQYAEFVAAQRADHAAGGFRAQLDYWDKQLGALPVLDLPADRPRPALAGHRGASFVVDYPAHVHAAATALAQQTGASLSMLLTSALGVVLARCTGQEDLPIGTTVLGRLDPEFEHAVGLFVNMVVLRLDMSGNPTFHDLLDRVRNVTLDAYDNQAVPFERVVDRVKTVRDPSRNPLFQVCVQVLGHGTAGDTLSLPEITVSSIPQRSARSRFDLSLTFVESGKGLALSAEYSAELFDAWRIEQLARHIERVITAAAADPRVHLSQIDLLSGDERTALIEAGIGPHDALPEEPVHVTVAQRAAAAPDAVAVSYEGARLTYGELNRRADILAVQLRDLGVGQQDIVGVAMDRGLDVLVAFLGVLKAGGAFVVLDTDHPANRLAFILGDAGVDVVLTSTDLVGSLPEPGERTYLCLDRDWPAIETASAGKAVEELSTRDCLVYVLYTSGSTGNPKGVQIEHRALVSYLRSFVDMFGLGPGDRMLQFASLAFDLSQAEIFSALISGAALVFCRRDTLLSPEALSAVMREEGVTYIGAPPAMLSLLEPEPYPALRNVLVGGEACPAELVNRWNLPGRKFVNGYGPTEATIGATMYAAPRIQWRSSPPIGGPLQHRRLYVVDKWGALAPVGVPGELLIGGDEGLARGYLNRPELNAARFIRDPFWPQGRVYRTGDLVRWNREHQLEFIGRVDTQVKLRGLRIELEEIEAVLAKHPMVGQAAVALREDGAGQQYLAGYVTLAGRQPPSVPDLRAHLGEYVPNYMVPTAWAVLDALPLSVAGKVNRRALPEPTSFAEDDREVTAPVTLAERHVAAAVAEVLRISQDKISVDDDFFELGGNSLLAMRVVSRLNRAFAASLGVRALYGASKLREIAANLDPLATVQPEDPGAAVTARPAEGSPATGPAGRIAAIFTEVLGTRPDGPVGVHDDLDRLGADSRQLTAIRDAVSREFGITLTERAFYAPGVLAAVVAAQRGEPAAAVAARAGLTSVIRLAGGRSTVRREPLFCVPAASGSPYAYSGLARGLGGDRPVYGFQAPGLEPGQRPVNRVEGLAERFVGALREHQPSGPYHLLGWSMGGLVAFEMARSLIEGGERVEFLAAVDTQLPDGLALPGVRELAERFVLDMAFAAGVPAPALHRLAGAGEESELLAATFALLAEHVLPPEIGVDQARRQWAVFEANSQATYAYRPQWTYPGRLTVIRTAGAPTRADAWLPLAGQVAEHLVPGDHNTMWTVEHLPALTALVADGLAT
jgi:amino acid adenylation domain-containing protein